ncbi:MAG: citramalate synthase [Alphaproteobacteria bacterium]
MGRSRGEKERVYLYDSTLRDGGQTQGVDFSATDKAAIASEIDRLGIDYIEGGWPGANPTDDAFFANPPTLKKARLTAFGMTRRQGRSASNDPGLAALLAVGADVVCMVGKAWDFHVEVGLGITREENLKMIADSFAHASSRVEEVIFDAEHFFDGYKADPGFALACVEAAYRNGARWAVLCDTNGGTLPHEIEEIVTRVIELVPGTHLGIHCHNDTENAVANSLAAVRVGVRQVQGTLNGLGERCGNANLISIAPTLMLKMGFETGISQAGLRSLTRASRLIDDCLNRAPSRSAAYVGESAFAHKGGLHASAVAKDPRTYEHIEPELVGNVRHIVVSDQSGRANILARTREIGLDIDPDDAKIGRLIEEVKSREHEGYSYDGADASFEMLARRVMGGVPDYFRTDSFRVEVERRHNAKGELVTVSQAVIKLTVGNTAYMEVAEGNGPVDALDHAMRRALLPAYEQLADLRLVDYKVRILTPEAGTAAVTRVMIESADGEGERWATVGISPNIIEASYEALNDSIVFKLFRDGAAAPA